MTNNIPPVHHIRNTSKLDKAAKFTVAAAGVVLAIVLLCSGHGLLAILVLLGTLALVALMHKLGKSKSSEGNTDKPETDTPRMADPQAEACNSSAANMLPVEQVAERFRQHLDDPTVSPEIAVEHDWTEDAHTGDWASGIIWVDHLKENISTLQKRQILQNMKPYVGSHLQALASVPLTLSVFEAQGQAAITSSNQLNYQQFKLEKDDRTGQWKLTFELLSSSSLPLDNQSKVALSYAQIAIDFTKGAREDLPTALIKGLEANKRQQVTHKLQLVDADDFQFEQDADLAGHITKFAKA